MVIAIILGTVLWGVVLAVLSRYVEIFATPWAWVISWFVMVCIVINVRGGLTNRGSQKTLIKEEKKISGSYVTNDGDKVAIVSNGDTEDNYSGWSATLYNDSKVPCAYLTFYPKDNKVVYQLNIDQSTGKIKAGEEDNGTYKYSGIVSKKLELNFENEGKMTFKKKSKDVNYWFK